MLDERDTAEFVRLVERIEHGSVSREDWSAIAALVLLSQSTETLLAIAAEGFDTFVARAAPIYRGHAFQHADYRRIFERVCTAVAHAPSTSPH